MSQKGVMPPLADITVVEISHGAAAAYAGRLLATLGAETILIEPPGGSPLRREPPLLPPDNKASALFAYLACNKKSVVCDLESAEGRSALSALLSTADILVHDFNEEQRAACGLDAKSIKLYYPDLIDASVLPFGAFGPKSNWQGEEVNLIHASGEGFLLPNGLSAELFPGRPPLKIHGHFAEYQGGVVAALGVLAALVAHERNGGESVDVSIQDAALVVGAFALQRYGDGSLEHRGMRSFKYGGVLKCQDGYVELLTLEDRQWQGLVELMGYPDWTLDPALADSLERSRRGEQINGAIRAWALGEKTADLVMRAQTLGVPMAKYASPAEVLADKHEMARGLFQDVEVPGGGALKVLSAPYHVDGAPLRINNGPPKLGEHQNLVARKVAAHEPGQVKSKTASKAAVSR